MSSGLSVTPDSTQNISASSGSLTFNVSNTGTGTMNWSVSSNQSWLTVSPLSGSNTGTVTAAYTAHTGTSARTASLTFTASGATGSPKTVQVTQAGQTVQPVLSVTPSLREVPAASGTATFSVSNTGTGTMNWSVSSNQSWLTVSPLSGTNTGTLTAAYTANTGTSARTASLTFTATGATGSPKTVQVTQAGQPVQPVLSVTPALREVPAASGTTTFSVSNTGTGTMNWSVSSNASWLTVSPLSGINTGTVTAAYTANTGTSARTVSLTFTASGATGSPKTVQVTQAGQTVQPVLSVTPALREVPAASGTATFSVSNTGTGTMNWIVSSNASWLTVSPLSGTNTGTVTASYTANTGTSARTASLTFTASGATGSPKTVQVTQAGQTVQPALSVTPSLREVSAASGTTTFSVSNTGTGTMNWIVSSSQSWLTVSPLSGTNTGTVTAAYTANTGTSARTASLTFTAPGATGSPKTVQVTQAGQTVQPALSVTPSLREVSAASGTTTFSVSNTGTGTMNWSVSSNQSWLTVSPLSGSNSGTVTAAYTANTGTSARTASLTFTASGATGSPKTVQVTQAGQTVQPVLSVTPSLREVPAASGTTTFSVSNTGTGTMNWIVSSSQSWLTVSPLSGTNTGTVTASYTANTGTSARTASLTFTASGATGSPKTVQVTQAGQTVQPVMSVTPSLREVSAASGTTTFSVSNTGTGTMNWIVSSNASWLTVSPLSGTNTGTVTASYTANTGTSARTASLTFTASGATGSPKTVQVTQSAGQQPVLSLTPSFAQSISALSGKLTFSVSNTGTGTMNWTVSSNQSWLTVSPSSGTNTGTVTAGYTENSGTTARTASLTFTASGATGSPKTVQVTQAGQIVTQGYLQVTINPSGAVTAGAKWTVAGSGIWRSSGDKAGLSAGIYTVEFNAVSGWTKPANQTVTVTSGQVATATGTYTLPTTCTCIRLCKRFKRSRNKRSQFVF